MAQRSYRSGSALLVLLVVGITAIHAAPASSKIIAPTGALEYPSRHAYFNGNTTDTSGGGKNSADILNSATKEFHNFTGLNATGQLDEATVKKVVTARCGVEDVTPRGNSTRTKRFVLNGFRWNKRHVTYIILNHPPTLRFSTVANIIAQAFGMWSAHADITFGPVRNYNDADIVLSFKRGYHGCDEAFDGPGNVYGHTYRFQGIVHFDVEEPWSVNGNGNPFIVPAVDLLQVAVHEIGHALGVAHSRYRDAVMFKDYVGYRPIFKLHWDDINAIQYLYGKKYRHRG